MKSIAIDAIHLVTADHSATTLVQVVSAALVRYGIKAKLIAFASDNASACTKMLRLGHWTRIPCAAHTIQLAIKGALKANEGLPLAKLRKASKKLKNSHKAVAKLRDARYALLRHLPFIVHKNDVNM
jgi:hypothetical protein